MSTAQRLIDSDTRICLWANRWSRRDTVAQLFGLVSRLGDGVFWYALMGLLPVAFGSAGLSTSLHMALTGLIALSLYRSMKQWFRRPRPFRSHDGVTVRIPPLDEFSFPSGHTLHAVSFSLIAVWHHPVLIVLLLPFTLLVAASRVILGLHYPSDVLAAILIGCALAATLILTWPLPI